jgi:hypothetical protein
MATALPAPGAIERMFVINGEAVITDCRAVAAGVNRPLFVVAIAAERAQGGPSTKAL